MKRVTVEDANGERVGVVSAVGHATSSERRGRGLEALRELSEIRQVFVMTCHVPWAEELVALGARRITLG